MDFTFSEEQRAAAEAARGVFAGVTPDAVPSPALTTGAVAEGFDRALWSRLADADLLSLLLAEAHGGAALDAIALCLVLREAGRVLARVPLLEHCAAAAAVQAYGGPEQVDRLPARAGRGELVLTVAAQGRTGHDRPNWPSPHAGRGGSGCWTGCRRRCRGRSTRTWSSYRRTSRARPATGPCWRWCRVRRTGWCSPRRSPPAVSGWPSCGCGPCGSTPVR